MVGQRSRRLDEIDDLIVELTRHFGSTPYVLFDLLKNQFSGIEGVEVFGNPTLDF